MESTAKNSSHSGLWKIRNRWVRTGAAWMTVPLVIALMIVVSVMAASASCIYQATLAAIRGFVVTFVDCWAVFPWRAARDLMTGKDP